MASPMEPRMEPRMEHGAPRPCTIRLQARAPPSLRITKIPTPRPPNRVHPTGSTPSAPQRALDWHPRTAPPGTGVPRLSRSGRTTPVATARREPDFRFQPEPRRRAHHQMTVICHDRKATDFVAALMKMEDRAVALWCIRSGETNTDHVPRPTTFRSSRIPFWRSSSTGLRRVERDGDVPIRVLWRLTLAAWQQVTRPQDETSRSRLRRFVSNEEGFGYRLRRVNPDGGHRNRVDRRG